MEQPCTQRSNQQVNYLAAESRPFLCPVLPSSVPLLSIHFKILSLIYEAIIHAAPQLLFHLSCVPLRSKEVTRLHTASDFSRKVPKRHRAFSVPPDGDRKDHFNSAGHPGIRLMHPICAGDLS